MSIANPIEAWNSSRAPSQWNGAARSGDPSRLRVGNRPPVIGHPAASLTLLDTANAGTAIRDARLLSDESARYNLWHRLPDDQRVHARAQNPTVSPA